MGRLLNWIEDVSIRVNDWAQSRRERQTRREGKQESDGVRDVRAFVSAELAEIRGELSALNDTTTAAEEFAKFVQTTMDEIGGLRARIDELDPVINVGGDPIGSLDHRISELAKHVGANANKLADLRTDHEAIADSTLLFTKHGRRLDALEAQMDIAHKLILGIIEELDDGH